MTADAYIVVLREHLYPWLKKQGIVFRKIIIFVQDNATSQNAHKATEYLQQVDFYRPRKMNGLANSPDSNLIKNLRSILKRGVYENVYNIMAKGFQFMPLGLVRLRTFRLSVLVT